MGQIFRRTAVIAAVGALLCPAACRPRATPAGPGTRPAASEKQAPPRKVRPPARPVMVGEMCPEGAAGRPGVVPVFLRTLDWSADDDDVGDAVRNHSARRFSVYAWNGQRAGVFSVAGSAEVGLDRPVAIGAYAGRSPCVSLDARGTASDPDPACVEAQAHCGLAIAPVEPGSGFTARPYGEEPDPIALRTGGGCAANDTLFVDIDGDGVTESFPAADFLGPVRGPAEEVSAVPMKRSGCKPAFSVRHVLPPADPKHWRGLDLVGVIDLDGDGRFELVMSYHYSDRRTWAVYTAIGNAGRLELAAESTPWPRP